MSVFNGQSYLQEAIQSVLAQTCTDFEFIIINDGSTDDSENVIFSFEDKRIVYVKNKTNLGLIASLNKGLEMATGTYIARMDADDIALPNRLEEQLDAFRKSDELVVVGSDYYLLTDKNLKRKPSSDLNDSDFLKTVLLFSTCFAHPTVMMKNIFKAQKINYESTFVHVEDYRLWTKLADKGSFLFINKPLLKYRYHAQQITTINRNEQYKASSAIRKDYLDSLGFSYSEDQLQIHNLVGNNTFITSKLELKRIESWLLELLAQNKKLSKINDVSFNAAIHKFWIDSCGNSNLGILAFLIYLKSDLRLISKNPPKQKLRLLIKCLLRWRRKK